MRGLDRTCAADTLVKMDLISMPIGSLEGLPYVDQMLSNGCIEKKTNKKKHSNKRMKL